MSYYGVNDALNDKREGYNMIYLDGGGVALDAGGEGEFCYDVDNSACPLMRNFNIYSEGTSQAINTYMLGKTWSQTQDPYLPCRFFGNEFLIKTPVIDNHFFYDLLPSRSVTLFGGITTSLTCIRMKHVDQSENITVVDVRNIYAIGQTLLFQSQLEPYFNADDDRYFIDNNAQNWCFTVSDFAVDVDGHWLLVVDNLSSSVGLVNSLHKPATEISVTISAKVLICSLPYTACVSESNPATYQHTALSTILFSDVDADNSNYVKVGDKYKQYSFKSLGDITSVGKYNNTLLTQFSSTQTGNEVFECEITESNRTVDDCKLELDVETLFGFGAGNNHEQRQQQIKFKFVDTTLNNQIKAGGINALTEIIGSNYMMFDFYNPANGGVNREIACFFIISSSHNSGSVNNFAIDATTGVITINGVRRSQELTQNNILTNGVQQETTNITVIAGQKYYVNKTIKFFTDLTAKYSNETVLQYRPNTWDWSLKYNTVAPPATNPDFQVPYWVYIKDNDNIFNGSAMGIYTYRNVIAENNYSSTFNMFYEYDKFIEVKQILLYDGYYVAENTQTVKHYQQKEFEITQNYSSPANIATSITKQTHDVGLARDKTGLEVPNSKSQGLIQNEFYFPVWSSFNSDNSESQDNGKLAGVQEINSFFLKYNLRNPSKHIYDLVQTPPVGYYDIYFRTKYTSVNRPISIRITDSDTPSQNNYYTQDFRQTWLESYTLADNTVFPPYPLYTSEIFTSVPYHIQYARCYNKNGFNSGNTLNNVNGYPIEYLPESYASQYCGSNNISLTWDDTISRFKFDYLHQTAVSKFIATNQGVTQDSGEPSTTIYYPTPKSNNGTPYKLPRTRVGGVNIENWTSGKFTYPSSPAQVRKIAGLSDSVDLSTEWFIIDKSINSQSPQLQNNYNVVGNRFWNKLGFDNQQIYNSSVGSETDLVTGRYTPFGSTDNLTDVADSISGTKEPTENTPYFNTQSASFNTKGETPIDAGYTFSSVGSMNTNNHLNGNGLPNTTGNPSKFVPNVDYLTNNTPESPIKPADPVAPTKPFIQYESQYNPDRERNTSYTFTTIGDSMVAGSLPTKTEFPYFLVMSDLIKSDFHVSANQGANLNCLGVISKANAEQDFYFQYQAPQSFFATKDEIISSITTEIRTPSLGVPSALSPYSSIIYQITRYEPIPIQTSEPIWVQQQMAFSQITNLLQQMVTSNSIQPSITADEEMIVNGVAVNADLPNAPILYNISDMTTDEIQLYEDMINVMRQKIPSVPSNALVDGIVNLSDISLRQPTAQGSRNELERLLGTVKLNDDESTIQNSSSASDATINLNPLQRLQDLKDFENESVLYSQGEVAPSYRSNAPSYRSKATTESVAPTYQSDASSVAPLTDDEKDEGE